MEEIRQILHFRHSMHCLDCLHSIIPYGKFRCNVIYKHRANNNRVGGEKQNRFVQKFPWAAQSGQKRAH